MPAKTFTCAICGESVTKPKSFAYQGGRACRTHPEAQEAHDANHVTTLDAKKRDEEKKEKDRAARQARHDEDAFFEYPPKPRCMLCASTDVLTLQDALFENMVDHHQFSHLLFREISDALSGKEHKTNELDKRRNDLRRRTLLFVKIKDGQKVKIPRAFVPLVQSGMPLLVCGTCRAKHGLEAIKEYEEAFQRSSENAAKLDMTTLAVLGAAVQGSLDEAVEKRLEKN